jgi:hydroxymethylglutaryl-CoA lyase
VGEGVQIVEVGPRDGLQNEDRILPTGAKVELVHRMMDAGATRIEATSFVHPRLVPQMADAEQVMAGVERRSGVSLAGLVLNRRGFERAVEAGVDEINYVVVATDTFSQRNQGMTTEEGVQVWEAISAAGADRSLHRTVTIGATFGCPFEGEVEVGRVTDIAGRLAAMGVDEICLADTIGVGDPADVTRKLQAVAEVAEGVALRCHFHNTRNTGLANAYAAVRFGVQALDASIGGIGGCPFAPNATGNIPTEDLTYLLERMHRATGLNLPGMLPSVRWVGEQLGKQTPGMLAKAGVFPPDGNGTGSCST